MWLCCIINKSWVKSLNTEFSLQSFGPGELSYTFVIETDHGRTLVHPQLPEPEAIREEPVVIIISDLETSPGKIQRLLLRFPMGEGTCFFGGGGLGPGLRRGVISTFLLVEVGQTCFVRRRGRITLFSARKKALQVASVKFDSFTW